MQKKTEFLQAWGHIQREGARDMLEWLQAKTDFFEAPASSRFHLSCKGGLLEHSLNVYNRLLGVTARDVFGGTDGTLLAEDVRETVAILGLLHDVCKVNVYHEEIKSRKNPDTGCWEGYRGYTYRDNFPLGHGEKSLFLIARFMPLTDEEALAIRWHMGAYDSAVKGGYSDMSAAMRMSPWVWRLQEADMCATYIDEVNA